MKTATCKCFGRFLFNQKTATLVITARWTDFFFSGNFHIWVIPYWKKAFFRFYLIFDCLARLSITDQTFFILFFCGTFPSYILLFLPQVGFCIYATILILNFLPVSAIFKVGNNSFLFQTASLALLNHIINLKSRGCYCCLHWKHNYVKDIILKSMCFFSRRTQMTLTPKGKMCVSAMGRTRHKVWRRYLQVSQ